MPVSIFTAKTEKERKRRFDESYGKGRYKWLLKAYGDNWSFNRIANELGVGRERVKQWYSIIYPKPELTGLERQELRMQLVRGKRFAANMEKLFGSRPFSIFYDRAYSDFPPEEIEPVSNSSVYDGFKKHLVKLSSKTVSLCTSKRTKFVQRHGDGVLSYEGYTLRRSLEPSEYMFCVLLPEYQHLFLRLKKLPLRTTFIDSATSKYYKRKGNFTAMRHKHG